MKQIWLKLIFLCSLGTIIFSPIYAISFPDIIARVRPSVVSINVAETLKPKSNQFPTPFGLFMNPTKPRRVIVAGSGFIVAVKKKSVVSATKCDVPLVTCYIITNNHVVKDAKNNPITIDLVDETTQFESKLVSHDAATDIAILSIPKEFTSKLKSLSLGDSDKLRIGDQVLAIGNPLGRLPGTVSSGIISGMQRNINDGPYDSFIQTDAAINRGNSGGPLINMSGAVVGINTAIYSSSGGSEGIGFAVPSNRVRLIVNKLIKYGKVERAALGVTIQPVTSEIANSLGLSSPRGALIQSVSPKGPAKGILKAGDVILAFNGKAVKQSSDLPWMVAQMPINSKVVLRIYRNKKIINATVRLLNYNKVLGPAGEENLQDSVAKHEKFIPELGMKLADKKDSNGASHVVIVDITPNSRAYFMGLKSGMIITHINQKPMKSVKQVMAFITSIMKKSKGKQVAVMLTIRDQGIRQGRTYSTDLFIGLWLNKPKAK